MANNAYLTAAAKLATTETRKVLKRVHAAPDRRQKKEVAKAPGRLLAKIATANPMPVLEAIVCTVSIEYQSCSHECKPQKIVLETCRHMCCKNDFRAARCPVNCCYGRWGRQRT